MSVDIQEANNQPIQEQETEEKQKPDRRAFIFGGVFLILVIFIIGVLSLDSGQQSSMVVGRSVSPLMAVFAFLAGLLSFLSPCTLPILPAYFAFTFQSNQRSIVTMTIAFFLGLATTMTLLGSGFTALGSLMSGYKEALTFWGGLIVVGFGLMSLFGKGFAGPQVQDRPVATTIGSYFYGATFALGWTACIGPILGALLTMLTLQGIGLCPGRRHGTTDGLVEQSMGLDQAGILRLLAHPHQAGAKQAVGLRSTRRTLLRFLLQPLGDPLGREVRQPVIPQWPQRPRDGSFPRPLAL